MRNKPLGGHFDLVAPAPSELAQMIRLPAQAAGLRFGIDPVSGNRLDDVLCSAAAASPDALPLLQYTLNELYRRREVNEAGETSSELGFAVLQSLGGLEGSLAYRADEVMFALGASGQAALPRVLSMMVTVDREDEAVTSRTALWADLRDDDERRLVDALVESRLLVSHLIDGQPGFGVAHEALLRRWPRVSDWVAEHRQALSIRERVASESRRWIAEGRRPDLLLPQGKPIDEARRLLAMPAFSLSTDERAFIDASTRKARRFSQLRQLIITMVGLLALVATLLGVAAVKARSEAIAARSVAEQKRTEAEGLMGFMLNDFADKMRPLARLDLLDAISSKALGYLTDDSQASLSPTALTQRAKALQVIAEVRIARGDTNAAREALLVARSILMHQAIEMSGDTEVLKNKGVNAYWLGKIHRDRNELDLAEKYYQEYLDTSNELNRLQPDNPAWWIEQSYGYNNLGGLAERRGNLVTARQQFELSLALKMRALVARPTDRGLLNDVADTYLWLGKVEEADGKLQQSLLYYQQGRQRAEELYQKSSGEARWTFNLAKPLIHEASVKAARGEVEMALADVQRAKSLLEELIRHDANNLEWIATLAAVQLDEVDMLAGNNRPFANEVASLNSANKVLARLVESDPENTNWKTWAAIGQREAAMHKLAEKKFSEAARQIDVSVQWLETLLREQPTRFIRIAAAETFLSAAKIAITSRARNKNNPAQYCERARNVLAGEIKGTQDYRLLDVWVRANHCLNQRDQVTAEMEKLKSMGYKQSRYLQTISASSGERSQ